MTVAGPQQPTTPLSPLPSRDPESQRPAGAAPGLWRPIAKHRHFYLFIAPFFILFGLFGIYPLAFSLYLSFTDWDGFAPIHWIGLRNFSIMLHDGDLLVSLWNTLVIGLLYVPPMLILALLLALALNTSWLRARAFFRASIFLPCVTPMVVIAIVFGLLLSSEHGLFNHLIVKVNTLPQYAPLKWLQPILPVSAERTFGLSAIPWLNSVTWSKPAIALLVMWRWTGYNMVLMLAGLQGISADYYEAASVDGATRLRAIWHITLPLMRPTILFCFILSLIGTVYMFDEVFVLTQGGPGTSSTNFGLYLFNLSFRDFRFGYASCVAYSVSFFVLIVSLILNRFRMPGEN